MRDRTSLYFINWWRGISIQVAFLVVPLLASELTSSLKEISSLLFLYSLANITSSIISGRLSDIYGRKPFIITGTIVPGILFFSHLFAKDMASLLFIRILTGIGIGILAGSLLAYVYETDTPLGRASGFVSLGFGAGGLLVSYIKDPYIIICIVGALSFLAFILSLPLKESGVKLKIPFFSFKVIKENLDIYLPFFLRHGVFVSLWTVYPLFLMSVGIPKVYIGWFYFTNSFFQFIFMPLVERFDSKKLFFGGLLLSLVVFFLLTTFRTIYMQWGSQIILAFSWSCLYMGAIKSILHRNVERASASGIFSAVMGFAGIAGSSLPTFIKINLPDIDILRIIGLTSLFFSILISILSSKMHLTKR